MGEFNILPMGILMDGPSTWGQMDGLTPHEKHKGPETDGKDPWRMTGECRARDWGPTK